MWEEVYFESYKTFFKSIKKNEFAIPHLLYLNKHTWEFALIALLCSDNPIIEHFIENVLQIDRRNVKVAFSFNPKNINTYPTNNAIEFIRQLINIQSKNKGVLTIDQIQVINFSTFTSTDVVTEMFYSLFITGMPVKNTKTKINVEKIIKKTEINFNGIDVKRLSEGEKKLILIYTITHLLAGKKTLVLLDEPNAYIHTKHKKDIVEMIEGTDCFTLFTTHSPEILNYVNEDNIRLIKNSKDVGVEVLKLDRINMLNEITNGEYSIIDATLAFSTSKDILLVEGANDYNYIMKAIENLSPDYDDYDFHIINCGGADNVPVVLEQSLLSILKDTQLCLCTFDYDVPGKRNYNKIKEISKTKSNIKAMYHPKLDNTPHVNKEYFYMENYFPVDTFKTKIIDDFNAFIRVLDSKTSFNELEKFSPQYQKPKKIIQNIYKTLDKSKFENFRVLLDETLRIKNDFHNTTNDTLLKNSLETETVETIQ